MDAKHNVGKFFFMLASNSDLPLEIRQGSWTQLKHGHQRREFEYQVEQHDIFGMHVIISLTTSFLQLAYDGVL